MKRRKMGEGSMARVMFGRQPDNSPRQERWPLRAPHPRRDHQWRDVPGVGRLPGPHPHRGCVMAGRGSTSKENDGWDFAGMRRRTRPSQETGDAMTDSRIEPEYPVVRMCDVRDGEQWRYPNSGEKGWQPKSNGPRQDRDITRMWVEVRPARQSDPMGVKIDLWLINERDHDDHEDVIITMVGEMRGRTDLDQWEYASTGSVGWRRWMGGAVSKQVHPDDFPVIVRRRA